MHACAGVWTYLCIHIYIYTCHTSTMHTHRAMYIYGYVCMHTHRAGICLHVHMFLRMHAYTQGRTRWIIAAGVTLLVVVAVVVVVLLVAGVGGAFPVLEEVSQSLFLSCVLSCSLALLLSCCVAVLLSFSHSLWRLRYRSVAVSLPLSRPSSLACPCKRVLSKHLDGMLANTTVEV